jgi:hypothetical protein
MSSNERFVRWHAVLRKHLSYAINLFLTFSVAALGYGFLLIRDKTFRPAGSLKGLFGLSLLLLWASLVAGCFCVLNRLEDFRGTALRARGADGSAPEKEYLDSLGKLSWGLFRSQVVAFGLVVTILGIVVLLESGRLS